MINFSQCFVKLGRHIFYNKNCTYLRLRLIGILKGFLAIFQGKFGGRLELVQLLKELELSKGCWFA